MRVATENDMKLSLSVLALVMGLAACAAPEMSAEVKGETTSRQAGHGGSNGTIYAEGMGARVRAGASTSTEIVGGVMDGTLVEVECWTSGESIDGNSTWDYVPSEGGYISDTLVELDGVVAECGADASNAKQAKPAPTSGDLRQRLVTEARQYIGTKATGDNCNPFTPQVSDSSCRQWCADFVHVVWRNAGADETNLGGTSISFYDQALRAGRWKAGAYADDVQPGDAVVWANDYATGDHVGMVTAVSGDSITVIHGNFWITPDNGSVYESTISRSSDVGTGAPIIGYASPQAR